MENNNKYFGLGVVLLMFGGAGMAEKITSGRGIFIISAIVFSFGLGLIIWSYKK